MLEDDFYAALDTAAIGISLDELMEYYRVISLQ